MSLYSLSVSNVQRSKGSSAVASASYIEDRTMRDQRLGKTFRYGSDKTLKHERTICLGSRLPNGQQIDTATLWNNAEASEKRSNSQTARKLMIALQIEHDHKTHLRQVDEIRRYLEEKYHVATTAAIHYEHDQNPHVHIMFTTREIDPTGTFGAKTRILDDKQTGPQEIEFLRAQWANICNRDLTPELQIDHRSYERQGINQTPQIHLGITASRMHRKGQNTTRAKWFEARERIRQQERQAAKERQQLKTLEALESRLELEAERAAVYRNFDLMEARKNANLEKPGRGNTKDFIGRRFSEINFNSQDTRQATRHTEHENDPRNKAGYNSNAERFLPHTQRNTIDTQQTNTETREQQESGRDSRHTQITRPTDPNTRRMERAILAGHIRTARNNIEKLVEQIIEDTDALALNRAALQLKQEIQRQHERTRPRTAKELLETIQRQQKERKPWKTRTLTQLIQEQQERQPQPQQHSHTQSHSHDRSPAFRM